MLAAEVGVAAREQHDDLELLRSETRRIWEGNAGFWDARFGEGNPFHKVPVEPSVDRLLSVRPDEHVLEIGCGNGAYARHLAAAGAQVVATDLSESFLDLARGRTTENADRIEYLPLDATDPAALAALGMRRFDAAVATMVLMDMPVIEPLLDALGRLLKPGGRFVFSVMHPCFNTSGVTKVIEETDRDGNIEYVYAMKVVRYLSLRPGKGLGMIGQPEPHYYFHRPLHELLGAAFNAGLVMDGCEEPAFPPSGDDARAGPVAWGNFTETPPVLTIRLRPKGT
jgi:2-polyprenyl-3-methyl-5-hydroxy-6-metoxy-1,4-benzoquinol methylase